MNTAAAAGASLVDVIQALFQTPSRTQPNALMKGPTYVIQRSNPECVSKLKTRVRLFRLNSTSVAALVTVPDGEMEIDPNMTQLNVNNVQPSAATPSKSSAQLD